MNRSRSTWPLCLLWLASACTALQDDPIEDATGTSVGRITRGINAKEVRKHYELPDASARDARVTAPTPSSQAGARPDAPEEPPTVVPIDAAIDAASAPADAGATVQSMLDATTVQPPPDPPPDPPPPDPPPPMCLPMTAYCDTTAQCCGALQCGNTTLGRVCCGLQREPCSRANGEECCGQLSCDRTTLGRVCCGERGAPCSTRNGEDCCRDLECIGGHCG